MAVLTINEVYRDYVIDGVPSSGPHKPHKTDIRDTLNARVGTTYDSKAALAAATVPAAVDVVFVAGNTAAGDDNDGEPVMLVRSPAATVGFLPDAAATKFAYLSHTIKLGKMFHGALTNGTGDNSNALIAAIDEIIAKGGGEIIIPAGEYQFTTGLANKLVGVPLTITWKPGARFVAALDFDVPLLQYRGTTDLSRLNARQILNEPRIDMSLGRNLIGTGGITQPSAISPSGYEEFYINDPDLYGGETQAGVAIDVNYKRGGDSGAEPLNISYFEARGGRIKGFLDGGVYAGGMNDPAGTDDGLEYACLGVSFERNVNAFIIKRSGYYARATDCTFDNNGMGVVTAEVPNPQDGGAAHRLEVTSNFFTRNTRICEFRAQTKGHFNDNICEDWGYDENAVIVATAANRRALTLNGARNISINDNRFRMVDLTTNAHIAIDIRNYTDINAVVWTGGAAVGENNSIINVERPLVEAAGVTQSIFGFKAQGGVTNTWTSIAHDTVIKSEGIGSTAQIIRVGNAGVGLAGGTAVYTQRKELFNFRGTSTYLSSIGSLAAATTSATVSIPVTGVASGDSVVLTPLNAGAMNPRLNYAMRALAGAVEVVVRNDHTAAVDFTALSFTLDVSRI